MRTTLQLSALLGLFVFPVPCALGDEPTIEQNRHDGASKPDCCLSNKSGYSKTLGDYQVPEVLLKNIRHESVELADILGREGPVLLQFAFTTCSTICPVMSSTSAQLQRNLGVDSSKLRMITISIDPVHDTPEVMKQYARSLGASQTWHFLTGNPADIAAVQKAFGAYTPNKSRHEALTFLRSGPNERWVRLTGLMSAAALTNEVRVIMREPQKAGTATIPSADDSNAGKEGRENT